MSFPATLIVTSPAAEPISRTEAKLHCRIDHSTEDDLVDSLIRAAREYAEEITGLKLMQQTWKAFYDEFPSEFYLPFAPVSSVTHIKYTDIYGTQTTWATTYWEANTLEEPAEIDLKYGQSYPTVTLKTVNPIEVQFVCGYASASDVPMPIRQAMYLLIGHWFDNRSAVTVGNTAASVSEPLKIGVESLLAPYSIWKAFV